MIFNEVITGFHALINAIGVPGNLLVIVTTACERFHIMRRVLLASLAVSFLMLDSRELILHFKHNTKEVVVRRNILSQPSKPCAIFLRQHSPSSDSCIVRVIQRHSEVTNVIQWRDD